MHAQTPHTALDFASLTSDWSYSQRKHPTLLTQSQGESDVLFCAEDISKASIEGLFSISRRKGGCSFSIQLDI